MDYSFLRDGFTWSETYLRDAAEPPGGSGRGSEQLTATDCIDGSVYPPMLGALGTSARSDCKRTMEPAGSLPSAVTAEPLSRGKAPKAAPARARGAL